MRTRLARSSAVIIGMVIVADGNRTKRLEWARVEAERQEVARQRAILEQQRREEEGRCRELEHQAELWAKSRLLRAYLAAVEKNAAERGLSLEHASELQRWVDEVACRSRDGRP